MAEGAPEGAIFVQQPAQLAAALVEATQGGGLFAGLADVGVRFKASHAQCDGSAHNDLVAGNCAPEKNSRAWIRPANCGRLIQI